MDPIHIATINGHAVRFYPAQSRDDMMPWVDSDDLARALGLSRRARLALRKATATHPDVARRVRTDDGATMLLAFQAVQGLMRGLIEVRQIAPAMHEAYVREVIAAAERASPQLFDRDPASGEMRVNSRVVAMLLGEDHQVIVDRIQTDGLAVDETSLH